MSYEDGFKEFYNITFTPSSVKPLRFTLIIENIFSIYRSLDFFKTNRCYGICFRILIEIAVNISSIVIHYIYLVPITASNNLFCYYSNFINSLFPVLFACCYSKKFNKLLLLIENNNSYFSNDVEYNTKLKKQDKILRISFVVNIPIVIVSALYEFYVKNTEINYIVFNIIFTINARICDWRNIFEYVALYSVLYVISQQLACIKRIVSKKASTIFAGEERLIRNESVRQTIRETRDFEELSAVFLNIAECCKLFNQIYGLQLVFMLGWATSYCILFLYTTAFLSIKGFHQITEVLASMCRLIMFFLLVLLLSQVAQKKQNNARDLQQQLGKLLIGYVDNDAEYKSTKDFLRLVSMRSTRTQTFGSIDVDMTLIPSVIMFITSNTVIALQFSNIM